MKPSTPSNGPGALSFPGFPFNPSIKSKNKIKIKIKIKISHSTLQ
jgi:hypothetical protein